MSLNQITNRLTGLFRNVGVAKTLNIFIEDSDPNSLKVIDMMNWSGRAYIGPNDALRNINFEDKERTGIYLLFSEPREDGRRSFYVGESEDFLRRIATHRSNHDWFTQFVVFVSTDGSLHKGHVKFLERELYLLAQEAIGSLDIRNASEPPGSKLPAREVSGMMEFLGNMVFVLEAIGLRYFARASVPKVTQTTAKGYQRGDPSSAEGMEFKITLPKEYSFDGNTPPIAVMTVRDGRCIIKAGSHIRGRETDSFSKVTYYDLWSRIVRSNAVTATSHPDVLVTTRDLDFASPSAAAAVALARSVDGPNTWRRVEDGLTLAKCAEEQAR